LRLLRLPLRPPQVVLNHRSPGWSSVYGFALPTKYACWAELLVMQLLVPEASFWGHLCGILAGLLHVLLTSRLPGLNGGGGGGARGGGGGQQRAQGGGRGGSSLGRLLAWLWSGAGRRQQQQRGRTYGRGTWGAASGSGGGDAAARGASYQVSLPCLCVWRESLSLHGCC
jgi:rhomboid domain-containing protein 1